MNEGELLTVAEAAQKLGLSERTTRRLIKKGELPSYRPAPRKIYVLRGDLDAFFESHRTTNNGRFIEQAQS